ncbi:hypothetical protein SAPIO_CDS8583 [Scedosporium apiospermum]|uniref:Cerato-platanin n=1 Tax=Pseudallescheria apiosperma TaxID=563466 RepID=A0A084FZZ4_PSEDA|nr:uncharacterized protein SAPIO_CDS8583 [Scedosporium apiospermum]KEZ40656.1 hypothetical protein SAPIO_CDS8583 [Scedosporium apiospermum]
MKATFITSALTLAASAAAASVGYDQGFDDASRSMLAVSCSDGSNGLASRFPTQGNLPKFPYIGGVPAIGGWNSPNCGSCWKLTYQGKSIYILGIDHSTSFNIALHAMNDLTNGNAVGLGRVEASAEQVDKSNCGL